MSGIRHIGNAPRQALGNEVDGWIPMTTLGKSEMAYDAWGVPKYTKPFSLFHGMFTFNVPKEMWVVEENGAENYGVSTVAYSENGKLHIHSGTNVNDYTNVESRRHPRYQPNRGFLYSSSIFLPTPDALAERRFGSFTDTNGVFFLLRDGQMYGVVRTTVDGVTTDSEYEINPKFDINYAYGNIYDIQMQWRGVGDIKFFIGNPESGVSEIVLHLRKLNTSSELSISNPALPIAFESTNTSGVATDLECGCVDLSTEGGNKDNRQYSSVTSGEVSLTTSESPVLAFRVPIDLPDGKHNTRDCALRRINAYANVDSLLRVYYFRDPSAITATWSQVFGYNFQEQAIDGAVTAFDKTKMFFLVEKRIPANNNIEVNNPDELVGDFFITGGDYLLVTIESKNNTLGGVTVEYGQEI